MIVRKAIQSDQGQLSHLFDGYRQFYQQAPDLSGASQFIASRLQNNDSVIFVAEDNDQLLGFTQLYPSFSSVSMQRLWVLNDLFIAAEARKMGVAKALMEQARQFAVQTQAKGLMLETDLDNHAAQKLYEQLGYQKQNDTYHFFLANKPNEWINQ